MCDNARYYDPARGQFLSADSIVPGSPNGGTGGIGLASLTTDLSDPMFAAQIVAEQAGGDDTRDRYGPANPQALNRYSYVRNNPVRWTDPTGHWTFSFNIGLEGFQGVGIRGSISIVIDTEGMIAGTSSVGGTGHANIGFNAGPSVTVTNAPTVDDLAGKSIAGGANGGEVLGVNVELVGFRSNGVLYGGGTLGGSATLKALPVDVYAAGDHTTIHTKVNPGKFIQRVYNEGVRELNKILTPPQYR